MASESPLTIEAMFDRIAYRYDFMNSLLSFQQDKRWRKYLARQLPEGESLSLLDIATGTGDIICTISQRRQDYVNFTGTDISKGMLSLAKKKLSEEKSLEKKSLQLDIMSAEELKFSSETFDAITFSFGLRNVNDKKKALRECFRVLKPGASLLILEFFNSSSGFMSWIFNFYFHYILPFVGGIFSDKKAYSYLPKSVESFYTLEEFGKIISPIGFQRKDQKVFLWGACALVHLQKPNKT